MSLKTFSRCKYGSLLLGFLLIFCAFAVSATPPAKDTVHYERTAKNISFFEKPMSGFVIGNLYSVRLDDGRYCNLLLADVEMDQTGIIYYFYTGTKIYTTSPALSDVLQAGLVGNTVAIGTNEITQYIPAFKTVPIAAATLHKNSAAFIPVASIKYIADSNQVGGSSDEIQSLADLRNELNASIKLLSNQRLDEENLLGVRNTVVAFDYIATTRDTAKAAKPRVVWIFNEHEISSAAREQLKDSFYFDEVYEFAPIGNDHGHGVLYGYHNWREANPNESVMTYLNLMVRESGLPYPDLYLTDMTKVDYNEIGYPAAEREIIGLCYAQIILEGRLEPGLKKIGLRSLQRQWSKEFLTLIPEELHAEWLHALDLEQKGLELF